MSFPLYLLRTPTGFTFRMKVPNSLRSILNKREIKKVIRTTDIELASRQAIIYAAKCTEFFERFREVTLPNVPLFSKLITRVNGDGSVEHIFDSEKRDEELLSLMRLGLIRPIVPSVVQNAASQSPQPFQQQQSVVEDKRLRLSDAIEMYFKDKRVRKSKAKTYNAYSEKGEWATLRLLQEFLREDKPIASITREEAREFRDKLTQYPAKTRSAERQKMSFHELIGIDPEVYCTETVNQRVTSMATLFNWFVAEDLVSKNPFKGLQIEDPDSDTDMNKRMAFNKDDIEKIFHLPVWTSKEFKTEWEFWLPLLLLHTGARIGELCQLEKKDIVQDNDIWCISINDQPTEQEPLDLWEYARKRVKSKTSLRNVPIHFQLCKLGFLDYVWSKPEGRIFEITPQNGKWSHNPSRRFNEVLLVDADVKIFRKKTFYSFRHTVLNELKQQRVALEERGQLAGHSVTLDREGHRFAEITALYGDEFEIMLMFENVMKLNFEHELREVQRWVENPTVPDYFNDSCATIFEVLTATNLKLVEYSPNEVIIEAQIITDETV